MKWAPWIIGLVVISLALYFHLNSLQPERKLSLANSNEKLTATLYEAKLTDYTKNRVSWIVNADKAYLYESQNITMLENIDGKLVPVDQNKNPTYFQADQGKLMGGSKMLIAWGNVKIDFNNGQKLFTEKIIFDQSKDIIFNNHKVLVISGNNRIHAKSMHYDLNSELLRLASPKAQYQLD